MRESELKVEILETFDCTTYTVDSSDLSLVAVAAEHQHLLSSIPSSNQKTIHSHFHSHCLPVVVVVVVAVAAAAAAAAAAVVVC